MFCRSCGTQNSDGAMTCNACGAVLVNPFQSSGPGGQLNPTTEKPANYLIQSILVTLCCCIPFGIVGIVYASQVDSKWSSGDYAGAMAAAANAKKWTMIGLIVGVIVNVIAIAVQALMFANVAANAGAQGGF